VWIPRPDTIRELLVSEDPRRTLVNHRADTVVDLTAALQRVAVGRLAEDRYFAQRAVDAFSEHPEAAQALATNALTTLIHRKLGYPRLAAAATDFSDWESKPFLEYRRAAVLIAVGKALDKNWPQHGEAPPDAFNRHAATHGVSTKVYTLAHALIALMALVGTLRELSEECTPASDPSESHPQQHPHLVGLAGFEPATS